MKYSTAPRPVAAPTATWLMRWVQPQALADSTLMARPVAAAPPVLTAAVHRSKK